MTLAVALWTGTAVLHAGSPSGPKLKPVVEVEEEVYRFKPADNGAGPMWCSGSTCLVRLGTNVFASGLETVPDCPPLNNCRWTLWQRRGTGWDLLQSDLRDRTREPSPLAVFPDGRLFLSVNPTLRTNRESGGGPAQPALLAFSAADLEGVPRTLRPQWDGTPRFTEHSYRTLAADGVRQELVIFQNVDYTHAEWSFLDREGNWSAAGQLKWPFGAEYEKPQPIRVCYPTVALRDRAVHFCGVSDILEPNLQWRAYKKQLTGREWDYDFRRLFYTWTPDIRAGKFQEWIEIASREKTGGWISPGDLWAAPDGVVHILWTERAIDERLRDRFFPDAKQSHTLNYARIRDGHIILQRTLLEAKEGGSNQIPSAPRFQVTPEGRLIVFYLAQGTDADGRPVRENRVFEIAGDGRTTSPVRVPFQVPFTSAFTATTRAGSAASERLDLLGIQADKTRSISYARVRLW